ncbi:uncharacterized protein LOC125550822 isoform X2 [Triticum urartu]|uniref:uncharacterized protein LOC125550819 isoform X2 n=1 Tax=Triticum urartu TaxID=4572 RepID=UPI0020442947|nr:uncharacterized protein LOC125550819 isoform X2 [Triticum urartu]XP_048569877.1 uncharacterized protein LOC125550822 isoform X2 [Triticum urartu]
MPHCAVVPPLLPLPYLQCSNGTMATQPGWRPLPLVTLPRLVAGLPPDLPNIVAPPSLRQEPLDGYNECHFPPENPLIVPLEILHGHLSSDRRGVLD